MLRDKFVRIWLAIAFFVGGVFGLVSVDWNVFALMFTATFLIWYSAETRGLRLETRYTNRLSVFPALTLRYELEGGDWIIFLSNIGKGPALNPKIKVLDNSYKNVKFILDGVNAVPPKGEVRISFENNNLRNDQNFLTKNLSTSPLRVRIEFSSAIDSRGTYLTELELKNPRDIKILKTNWY